MSANTTVRVVCTSRETQGAKNKTLAVFKVLDDFGKITDQEMLFDAKTKNIRSAMRPFVGGIYDIQREDTGWLLGDAKYIGHWENKEEVAKWQASDRAEAASNEAAKRRTKDGKHDAVLGLLEPLRDVYWSLPAPARAQLLAQVVERLTRRK